jgi:hypothetical protein
LEKKSGDYVLLSLTLNGVIKRDMENPQEKFPAEFYTYQEVKKGDFIFCLFDVEETPSKKTYTTTANFFKKKQKKFGSVGNK